MYESASLSLPSLSHLTLTNKLFANQVLLCAWVEGCLRAPKVSAVSAVKVRACYKAESDSPKLGAMNQSWFLDTYETILYSKYAINSFLYSVATNGVKESILGSQKSESTQP